MENLATQNHFQEGKVKGKYSEAFEELKSLDSKSLLNKLLFLEKENKKLIEQNKQLMNENKEAYKCATTGAYTRQYLSKFNVSKEMWRLVIDMNLLKYLNDKYGHRFGDLGLKRIADVCQQSLRSDDDLVVRYGGDEFLVFIKAEEKEIKNIAERLEQKIGETSITLPNGERLSLSAAVGYGKTTDEADERMYKRKKIYHKILKRSERFKSFIR